MNAIDEAKLLGYFKSLCEYYSSNEQVSKIRDIMALSSNKQYTIKQIVKRICNEELSDDNANRMVELVNAFLRKSDFRKTIPNEIKNRLLINQDFKCAFCHNRIDISSHADHIVPFKYVGDELENNLQMLCSSCNTKKNASIDYEIRVLLNLV